MNKKTLIPGIVLGLAALGLGFNVSAESNTNLWNTTDRTVRDVGHTTARGVDETARATETSARDLGKKSTYQNMLTNPVDGVVRGTGHVVKGTGDTVKAIGDSTTNLLVPPNNKK